jgi:hypothetical protein
MEDIIRKDLTEGNKQGECALDLYEGVTKSSRTEPITK